MTHFLSKRKKSIYNFTEFTRVEFFRLFEAFFLFISQVNNAKGKKWLINNFAMAELFSGGEGFGNLNTVAVAVFFFPVNIVKSNTH